MNTILNLANRHNCMPSVIVGWILGAEWPHRRPKGFRSNKRLRRIARYIREHIGAYRTLFRIWFGAKVEVRPLP